MTHDRITMRLTKADAANLLILARSTQTGRASPFVTRAATLRHALKVAATAAVAVETREARQ